MLLLSLKVSGLILDIVSIILLFMNEDVGTSILYTLEFAISFIPMLLILLLHVCINNNSLKAPNSFIVTLDEIAK